jgi:hypothetical protein
MSNSNRDTAARWLSMLPFAVTIAAVTIAAVTIGGVTVHAQSASVDRDRWMSCTVTGLIGYHYPQGPNFSIRVSFREQPVAGVKVVLTDETAQPNPGVAAIAHTDPDGVARFFAIPPGLYQAHINQGLLSPSQEIEVHANQVQANEVPANHSSAKEVPIEWPWSPAVTRSVRGWITSWQKDSPQNRSERRPFARALVQLLDLRSGKLLASTHTNADGYYEFAVSSDGLYVLRVSEAQDPSRTAYDRAVEVAWQASRDSMSRLEVDHACGGGLVELPDTIDRQDTAVTVASGK